MSPSGCGLRPGKGFHGRIVGEFAPTRLCDGWIDRVAEMLGPDPIRLRSGDLVALRLGVEAGIPELTILCPEAMALTASKESH